MNYPIPKMEADETEKRKIKQINTEKSCTSATDPSNSNSYKYNNTKSNMSHSFNPQNHEKQHRKAREYAQELQCWLWQYRMWSSFSALQAQIAATLPPPSVFQPTASFNSSLNNAASHNVEYRNGQTAPSSSPMDTNQLYTQYKVPMLWKRIAAECLDFILLFYTKILVTVAVLQQMGYVNDNLLDLDVQLPLFADIGEMDYDKMFSLTSELIALEVVNRLCITLVETMCLRKGYAGSLGGATPGKKIMKLRVLSFDEVRDLRNGQVLLTGAGDPGFFNALIRSVIKNFSLAFFFPACFTVFFFRFNRAAYDILSQTIVVEVDHRHTRR